MERSWRYRFGTQQGRSDTSRWERPFIEVQIAHSSSTISQTLGPSIMLPIGRTLFYKSQWLACLKHSLSCASETNSIWQMKNVKLTNRLRKTFVKERACSLLRRVRETTWMLKRLSASWRLKRSNAKLRCSAVWMPVRRLCDKSKERIVWNWRSSNRLRRLVSTSRRSASVEKICADGHLSRYNGRKNEN